MVPASSLSALPSKKGERGPEPNGEPIPDGGPVASPSRRRSRREPPSCREPNGETNPQEVPPRALQADPN